MSSSYMYSCFFSLFSVTFTFLVLFYSIPFVIQSILDSFVLYFSTPYILTSATPLLLFCWNFQRKCYLLVKGMFVLKTYFPHFLLFYLVLSNWTSSMCSLSHSQYKIFFYLWVPYSAVPKVCLCLYVSTTLTFKVSSACHYQ